MNRSGHPQISDFFNNSLPIEYAGRAEYPARIAACVAFRSTWYS